MKIRKTNIWKIILFTGLILLIIFRFDHFISLINLVFRAFIPLLVGMVFAFILNILLEKLEKRYFPNSNNKWVNKTRRPVSILLSLFIVLAVMSLVGFLVIPEFINTLQILAQQAPKLAQMAWDFAVERGVNPEEFGIDPSMWNEPSSELIQRAWDISKGFLGGFVNVASSIIGVVANIVLGFVFAIYILNSKEKLYRNLTRFLKAYLPKEKVTSLFRNASIFNETFKGFFGGQITEAIILGVLTTVLMFVFRFPYPTMIGSVIGLTNIIPIVGPFIGGAIGFLIMLPAYPVKALWFILFVIALQQLEGDLLYPRVVGDSVGVSGLWILGAVTVGTSLYGVLGAIIAVPLVASIYKIVKYDVGKIENDRREEIKKKQDETISIQ